MLEGLSVRLARQDFLQVSVILFVMLLFAMLISWPSMQTQANDSWFTIAQLRLASLVLIALGYGAYTAVSELKQVHEVPYTLLALLFLGLISSPLEVASYAASYPHTSLTWSLGLNLLDTVAFFGIGHALGHGLSRIRLAALVPMMVPALAVGIIALDIALGIPILNPLAALTGYSLWHSILMGSIAILSAHHLWRQVKKRDQSQ